MDQMIVLWKPRDNQMNHTFKNASKAEAVFRSAGMLFKKRATQAHPAANPWGFFPPATSVCQAKQLRVVPAVLNENIRMKLFYTFDASN